MSEKDRTTLLGWEFTAQVFCSLATATRQAIAKALQRLYGSFSRRQYTHGPGYGFGCGSSRAQKLSIGDSASAGCHGGNAAPLIPEGRNARHDPMIGSTRWV